MKPQRLQAALIGALNRGTADAEAGRTAITRLDLKELVEELMPEFLRGDPDTLFHAYNMGYRHARPTRAMRVRADRRLEEEADRLFRADPNPHVVGDPESGPRKDYYALARRRLDRMDAAASASAARTMVDDDAWLR